MEKQGDFQDKVFIVTGAADGIGFEIARSIGGNGGKVIVNDIDKLALESALKDLNDMSQCFYGVAGDAGDLVCIQSMIELAMSRFGRIDGVVANAGLSIFQDFLDFNPDEFDELLGVNLKGSFFLAQKASQEMIKQKSDGRIIFMSSVTGHQHHPKLSAYGMTKAALEMLAKSLGVDLAPHGITVNAIAPGATLTSRNLKEDTYQRTWEQLTPTGKVNTSKDVANTTLFLLSDEARQITGQTIIIDGGWTSYSPPPPE